MSVSLRSIFISYSHQDTTFVERLRADLEQNGFTIWVDKIGLKPGTEDWDEELRRALREAQAMVLVASPSSRRAKAVKDELRIADMYRIFVIPVWAEGEEWMDSIPVGHGGMQYCDARGDKYESAVRDLIAALRSDPSVSPTVSDDTPPPEPRNPYKGLAAFTGADSRDFFGREKLVSDLVGDIQSVLQADSSGVPPERLVAVLGPSGSGKSSVVMAGLLPRLRAEALPGSDRWVYLDPMVPGVRPIEALASTFYRSLPQRSMKSLLEDLNDTETRGLQLLASSIPRGQGARVVLMIDQFEELFNLTSNERDRQKFIDLLLTAVTEPHGPLLVLLTLRADFYDRPMQYSALYQVLQHHQRSVLPMDVDDLRDVIEKPAKLPDVQVAFEGRLVGDLLFDVYREVGGLPLLEFTLDQLFRRRDDRLLTQEAYREIGGVRGALTKQAEDTYDGLPSDEHRQMAQVLFLRLIDPRETEQDTTRRRATLQDLTLPNEHKSHVLQEVTNTFVNARLLVEDKQDEKVTVEVAHEALIRSWPRLAGWLLVGRDDARLEKRIGEIAAEWSKAKSEDRKQDLLYRGGVLADAQSWLERGGEPSANELAFIQASVEASEREKLEAKKRQEREQAMRRRIRTLWIGLTGAVALLVVFVVIPLLAFQVHELQTRLGTAQAHAQKTVVVAQATVGAAQAQAAAVGAAQATVGAAQATFGATGALLSGTYTVTNLSDNGQGSLRQAITTAHTGSAIVFNKGLTGTIVLNSPLTITKNLDIEGPGATAMTISGGGKNTVFDISDNVIVTISGLTVTDGDATSGDATSGGGIFVGDSGLDTGSTNIASVVSLLKVTVTNSHADSYGGGIFDLGNLTLTDCMITGNSAGFGGGIAINNGGHAVFNSTQVEFNKAQHLGGGIYNYQKGYFYLNDSVVQENTAQTDGGGVYTVSNVSASCGGISSTVLHNTPDNYNVNPSCKP
ncbi:MAG: TIR domain-containing protein [Ktedonobacterales bacterium]